MNKLLVPGMALVGMMALGACGGGGSGAHNSGPTPVGHTAPISTQALPGVGAVLVDRAGKPLYTSDQEASGRIVCTGSCTAFWKPVAAVNGTPASDADAGKLGVLERPDGSKQLTANGNPLYTFSEDSPGKASGDGFRDAFSGHRFTWHVVRSTDNARTARQTTSSSRSYGY
jgi:predicted lipoprotein with Yx(FWY)xxD motif